VVEFREILAWPRERPAKNLAMIEREETNSGLRKGEKA
jgi:hypothetical protein